MEFLIRRGTPQRSAHHLVGELVRTAMDRGIPLAELKLEEFQALDESLDDSVFHSLGVANALAAFQSEGSTAPQQVADQTTRWESKLASRK